MTTRARALRWGAFEARAPELAAAVRRLLTGADGVAIGFLASMGRAALHLSPVCPVFSENGLYLIAATHTPKARDLRERGSYALHALLGANDEEAQLVGRACEVSAAAERASVQRDVRFAAFERSDPIFELTVERALWVFWERVGQPDTRARRLRWSAAEASNGP